jgi:hypothetical protein
MKFTYYFAHGHNVYHVIFYGITTLSLYFLIRDKLAVHNSSVSLKTEIIFGNLGKSRDNIFVLHSSLLNSGRTCREISCILNSGQTCACFGGVAFLLIFKSEPRFALFLLDFQKIPSLTAAIFD